MSGEKNKMKQIPIPLFYKSPGMKSTGLPVQENTTEKASAEGEQMQGRPKKEERHRFQPGMNVVQPVGSIGDASVQTVKHEIEGSDENYYAGLQEER